MPHSRIGSKSSPEKEPKKFAEDSKMKPLVRSYIKDNPGCIGKEFPVIAGRLTTNGWFLLEVEEFVYLLPGGSSDAQHLFTTIFPALDNQEKKQLLLVPDKGDKFGAYLAVDTEKRTTYVWDEEEYILYVGGKPGGKKKKDLISLEDFE